ncbi:dTDP-4-dehydrorhamnose 3,5-epimerase [Sediminicola sp. YIK13]|uniref:dTDP-4-dehydrorhamnose 3,5-epimerase n=1 Tax=Sediminicola sp. YIK13 TaxID=1453352 RepID=UPI0007226687|nr:dTDP-4-dehydrorhamnose 3,5-epimerase [Sediminicola sp. YIK13]ALM08454.1 dTDP-4-dehydrorhamnose 3,5-epimerase [Sediminicola sp. YIK13]
MKVIESPLKGCYILEPITYEDERGLFYESYHKDRFDKSIGENVDFVQDNVSISKKGVLRGLHYQKGDSAQAKLVHVVKGEVLDVIVDLRKGSPSFGKHFKMRLSDENRTSIFIPKGMAHGFLALTDDVIFSYKCDALYNPKSEAGILYSDPALDINWEMAEEELILSKKDLKLPLLKELEL